MLACEMGNKCLAVLEALAGVMVVISAGTSTTVVLFVCGLEIADQKIKEI
jgi:pantothenate kinase type III